MSFLLKYYLYIQVSLQFSPFNSIRILGSEPTVMSCFLWLGRKQWGKEKTEERSCVSPDLNNSVKYIELYTILTVIVLWKVFPLKIVLWYLLCFITFHAKFVQATSKMKEGRRYLRWWPLKVIASLNVSYVVSVECEQANAV